MAESLQLALEQGQENSDNPVMKARDISIGVALLAAMLSGCDHVRKQPDGILIAAEPLQSDADIRPWKFNEYVVTPRASYTISARVLRTARYWLGREASIAPIDVAVGWGDMSDNNVLSAISISQGGRFYFWSSSHLPRPVSVIASHSANMHLIPANDEVLEKIKSLDTGDLISMRGYLVNLASTDGWSWNSSLSRTDTGAGACELMWVESLRVL